MAAEMIDLTSLSSAAAETTTWKLNETSEIETIINGTSNYDRELYNNNTMQYDLMNNQMMQMAFCALYSSIFVLGIFGNVLVCYVVFRNKAMQTVTNLFITNLALSDILLCVLAIPFTPLYTFMRKWVFGTLLCHLVPYAQGCSVYISTLTLTSIAIDRFFVIIYPFHPRMQMITCILIIVSIWLLGLILTVPYGLFRHVYILNDTGMEMTYCEENWPSEYYRKIFGSITSMLQFLLPFLLISFCYICVSIQLAGRAKAKPGSKTSRKEEADRDRKRRTNRMLISMVGVFGLSWLPLNVVNILNDFYATTDDWRFYNFIFFIAHSIAMSSTCYNPFLYAWLNENFRKEFKLVLPCFNPSRGISRNSGGSHRWQREQTINGNNETTLQESLLTSRVSVSQLSMRDINVSGNIARSQSALSGFQQTICVSDVGGTSSNVKSKKSTCMETKILPTGVMETDFEDNSTL